MKRNVLFLALISLLLIGGAIIAAGCTGPRPPAGYPYGPGGTPGPGYGYGYGPGGMMGPGYGYGYGPGGMMGPGYGYGYGPGMMGPGYGYGYGPGGMMGPGYGYRYGPGRTYPSSGASFGQVATQGANVYTYACASCHGAQGEGGFGPPLIGSSAKLSAYKTGEGLLNYIESAMPPNAPGSLSAVEYQQVAAFILLQNDLVSSDTAWDPNKLNSIAIK